MRFSCVVLAAGLALATIGLAPHEAEARFPDYFAAPQLPSPPYLPSRTRWHQSLERFSAKGGIDYARCSGGFLSRCFVEEWREFLDSLKTADRWTQINHVNSYINGFRYRDDPPNWGHKDYWANPVEFLQMKSRGDCEDYAIAKYHSLRYLGFTADEMRIVAVKDLNLNALHAVLIVNYQGNAINLDNQLKTVVEARHVRHYRPLYAMNETDSWWHIQ